MSMKFASLHRTLQLGGLLLLLGFTLQVQGASYTWVGSMSNDWNDGANWDLGSIPGAGDSVFIEDTSLSGPVMVTGVFNIGSLSMGTSSLSELVIGNGGNLTLTASLSALTFAHISLEMGGIFALNGVSNQISGIFTQNGGRLEGTDDLLFDSGSKIDLQGSDPKEMVGLQIVNYGDFHWSGTGDWTLDNVQLESGGDGGTLSFDADANLIKGSGSPLITNYGSLVRDVPAFKAKNARSKGVPVGTHLFVDVSSNGNISSANGDFYFHGANTFTGAIFAAGTGTSIFFEDSQSDLDQVTFSGAGFHIFQYGATASFVTNASAVDGGTVFKNNGASMIGDTTLNINGSFYFHEGSVGGNLTLSLPNGSDFFMDSPALKAIQDDASLLISGKLQWTDGSVVLRDTAEISVSVGGEFFVSAAGQQMDDGASGTPGSVVINSYANFNLEAAVGLSTNFIVPFDNHGMVHLITGKLKLGLGGDQTMGYFDVDNGQDLEMEGDHTLSGTQFQGAGEVVFRMGLFSLTGDSSSLSSVVVGVDGANLDGSYSFTAGGEFFFAAGEIRGGGNLVCNDVFRVVDGNNKLISNFSVQINNAAYFEQTDVFNLDQSSIIVGDSAHLDLFGSQIIGELTPESSSISISDNGVLNKYAGILKRGGIADISTLNVALTTSSTSAVDIQAGVLVCAEGATFQGFTVNINYGARLELVGSAFMGNTTFSGGGELVFLNGSFSISGLVTAQTGIQVALNNATLSSSQAKRARIGSTFVIDAGAQLNWHAGTLDSGLVLALDGDAFLDTPGQKNLESGAAFEISGHVRLQGLGDLNMGEDTVLHILGIPQRKSGLGGAFEFTSDADILNTVSAGNPPTVINDGELFKSGGTLIKATGPALSSQIQPALTQNGLLLVEVGELELRGGGTAGATSSFEGYTGTKLSIFDTTFDMGTGSTATNLDHLLVGSAQLDVNGSYFFNQLTVDTGGLVNFYTDGTVSNMTLQGNGLGGTGKVTVDTQFDWVSGSLNDSLILDNTGNGSTNSPDTKYIYDNATLLLNGSFNWDQGLLELSNFGQFHVGTSGNLFLNSPFELNVQTVNKRGVVAEQFRNEGLIQLTGNNIIAFDLPLANYGSLDLLDGSLVLRSGGTNDATGTITMNAPGGTPTTLENQAAFINEGTLQGAGILRLTSDTFTNNGTFNIGFLNVEGGTFAMTAFSETGNLNLTSGSVAGYGGLTVYNELVWSSGTITDSLAAPTVKRGTIPVIEVQTMSQFNGTGTRALDGVSLHLQGESFMTTGSLVFSNNAELVNEGQFHFDGSGLALTGTGSFLNKNFIDNRQGSNAISVVFSLDPASGTVLRSVSGLLSIDNSVTLLKGSVELTGGDLSFNDTLELSGGYFVGAGTIYGNLINGGDVTLQLPVIVEKAGKRGASIARTLNVTGNYTQTGILNVDIDGPDAGTTYDLLHVMGQAILGGSLNVYLDASYLPPTNQEFVPITYGSRDTTEFAAINLSSIVSGATLYESYLATEFQLLTSGPPNSNWTGAGGDGNWDNPTNWQELVVPGMNSSVSITLDGTYEVRLSSDVHIHGLTLGPVNGETTFSTNSWAMMVESDVLNNGSSTFDLQGSAISFSKPIRSAQFFNNYGEVHVSGNASIGASIFNQSSGKISIQSSASNASILHANFGLDNNGLIEMSSSDSLVEASLDVLGAGLVNQYGADVVMDKGAGGIRILYGGYDNHGTFTVNAPCFMETSLPANKAVEQSAVTVDFEPSARSNSSYLSNDGKILLSNMTLTLNGLNLYNLEAGEIEGDGEISISSGYALANVGGISPGGINIGHLKITGDMSLETTSRLYLQLAGLTQGTEYDWLEVTGNLTTVQSVCGSGGCGGAFNIELVEPFLPQYGNEFETLTFNSFTGTFSEINGQYAPNSTVLNPLYETTVFRLVTSEPSVIHWAQAINGNWSDPANWTPNALPGPMTDVFIDTPGNYEVILDTDGTIGSLTVGGSNSDLQILNMTNHNLALVGPSRVEPSGLLKLDNASLTAGSNPGRPPTAATFENRGSIFATNLSSILMPFSNYSDANLDVISGISGVVAKGNGDTLTFSEGFLNQGHILLKSQDYAESTNLVFQTGKLENDWGGTLDFEVGAGGDRNIETAGFTNFGEMHIAGSVLLQDTATGSGFSNEGKIFLLESELSIPNGNLVSLSSSGIQGTGSISLASLEVQGLIAPIGQNQQSGLIEITGNLVFGSSAQFQAALFENAPVRGSQDSILVSGSVALDGNLEVQLATPFFANQGSTYDLISAGTITGGFASENYPLLPNNLEFGSNQTSSLFQVEVKAKADLKGLAVFVTNPSNNSVSVIAGGDNQPVTFVPVGSQPQTPVASADGATFWVPCSGDGTVHILSKTQPQVIHVLSGLLSPVAVAFKSDHSEAWVLERNGSSSNRISIYNPNNFALIDSFTPTSGAMGMSIAYNPVTNHFYVGSDIPGTNLSVINAATHAQVAGLTLGGDQILPKPPGEAFVVLGNGSVTKVNAVSFATSAISVPFAPVAMDISGDGSELFLAGDGDKIYKYNFSSATGTTLSIPSATGITSVAVLEDLGIGYAADPGENQVFSFDPVSGGLISKTSGPFEGPTELASNKTLLFGSQGSLEFSAPSYITTEGEGALVVEVRRVGGSTGDLSAIFATQNGTAVAPGDFTAITNQLLTFADQDTKPQTVSIAIQDDATPEFEESFSVNLYDPASGGTGTPLVSASVALRDNETGQLQFSTSSYATAEGQGQVVVEVQRVGGFTGPLDAVLSTADGTAQAPGDYTAIGSQSVHFDDGDTTAKTFAVVIIDDAVPESTENFKVNLSSVSVRVPFASATVNIADNEPGELQFSASSYSVGEGAGSVTVVVQRVNGSAGALDAVFSTANVTTQDGDYIGVVSQPVHFAAGDSSPQNLVIQIVDDALVESNEVFSVNLSRSGTIFATANVTITDNDTQPAVFSLHTANATISEGDGAYQIRVNRSGNFGNASSVRVISQNGTAVSGSDFTTVNQVINFPAGSTASESFTMNIVNDLHMEIDEDFTIRLEAVSNATLGSITQTTVTIRNDDFATVSWLSGSQTLQEGTNKRTASVILDATLSLEIDYPISISLGTSGTPVLNEDYRLSSTSLSFPAGVQQASVTFSTIGDGLVEGDEVLTLSLLSGEVDVSGNPELNLTIQDDDVRTVSWTTTSQSLLEGTNKSSQLNLVASLSQAAESSIQVPITLAGTATLDTDYQISSQQLEFPAGQTTASVLLETLEDSLEESDETIILTLNPPSGLVSQGGSLSLNIQDDDQVLNQAPETSIVFPSEDQEFRTNTPLTLQATAVDDGPAPLSYRWEICLTAGGCSSSTTGETLEHQFPEPGLYNIICYAIDGAGLEDPTPAQVSVRVFAENIAPAVEITDPTAELIRIPLGTTRDFVAEGTDQEGGELSYSWHFARSPDELTPGQSFSHTFDLVSIFTLIVEVKDPEGATGLDWVTVEVYEPVNEPTAVRIIEPTDGAVFLVGEVVPFSGEIETGKNKTLTLYWDKGDGAAVEASQLGEVVYTEPGRYLVRLVASEGELRFEDQATIFVEDPNTAPEIDMNLTSDITIEPAQFPKVDSTPDGVFLSAIVVDAKGHQNISYNWDFGDTLNGVAHTSNYKVPGRIQYAAEGVYQVKLFATVGANLKSNVVTRTITVRHSDDGTFEPNEDFSQAPLIQPGNYNNLVLDVSSNIDFFRFEITEEGQTLNIHIETQEAVSLSVFDANQNLLETRALDGDGNLQLLGLAVGTYYMRVNASNPSKDLNLSYGMSLDVLNPALYFPGIVTDASSSSEIGVINLANQKASVSFEGYDNRGNLLQSVPISLESRARYHQTVDQLFGDKARRVAWVQVNSTVDLDGYSRTISRDRVELSMVSASKKLTSDLFVPHIAEKTDQWFTKAAVINGSDKAKSAQASLPGNSKALGLDVGFASDTFDFLERFETLPANNAWAEIKESGENLALAGIEVFGRKGSQKAIAGLQLVDNRQDNPSFTYVGNNIIFTHIARNIESFFTGIALVNLGAIAQGLRVRPFDKDGVELENKTLSIEPYQKLVKLAADFLPASVSVADVDWLIVEADRDVAGFEIFGTQNGLGMAGIEGTTSVRKNLNYSYIDNSGTAVHGISLVNPNNGPNQVLVELRSEKGEILQSVELTLAANQKVVRLIEDLFPGAIGTATQVPGYISVTGQLPLAGFLLYFSKNGEQMGGILAE